MSSRMRQSTSKISDSWIGPGSLSGRGERLVDPRCRRQGRGNRHSAREALRVCLVGGTQYRRPVVPLGPGEPVVNVMRGHEPEGTVAMLRVVPREEPLAEGLRILVGPESVREVRPVLEGLELRLGEGVVIGDVGPGVRRHDAQGGQEQGTGWEVIAGPRSAWITSWSEAICCRA